VFSVLEASGGVVVSGGVIGVVVDESGAMPLSGIIELSGVMPLSGIIELSGIAELSCELSWSIVWVGAVFCGAAIDATATPVMLSTAAPRRTVIRIILSCSGSENRNGYQTNGSPTQRRHIFAFFGAISGQFAGFGA
jgi:hypothetical protein